ncbi:hypothetical protein F4679DRAFT_593506 [Xylaria curta]|nr:hypothetical protein F4679DRAFT_593506 [Xylaria curta]
MVRFLNCAVASCPNAAAIDIGSCERCKSTYYATHVGSALHTCEKTPLDNDAWLAGQTKELADLSEKTNHAALLRHAKELSGGLECRLDDQDPLGRHSITLAACIFTVNFYSKTGLSGLLGYFILRKNHMSFDDELSDRILMSECATLRWLEPFDLPTPRLHGYGLRAYPKNEVGIAYKLIDRLSGRPYNPGTASQEQKLKVLHQFSWAKAYAELIADGQLFSTYSLDAYLMFKYLEEQVKTGRWLGKWQDLHSGPFFLKHMDDKGDHILIDDDFQITGIIDWTFARIVPAYEAFGPSLMSANTTDLFNGNPGLSQEDKTLEEEVRHRGALHCYFESNYM